MKQVLQHILTLLVALTAYINMCAQTVTNVEARQEGQTIVITFNMDKPAEVSLYYSTSGKYGKYQWINSKYLTKQRISSTKYSYTWDVLGQCGDFSFNNVVFRVEAQKLESYPFYISIGGFYSLNNDLGAIFRLGYKGMYVGYKTNFKKNQYYIDKNLNVQTDIFRKDSELVSLWGVMGGANWFWRHKYSIYTGAGYGQRVFSAERLSGNRYKIDDNSTQGLILETGVNAFISNHVGFSIGYSVLTFQYSEFMGGIVFRW